MTKLILETVCKILDETELSFPHGECLTCECFLGLAAQLKVDAQPDAKEAVSKYQVGRERVHACLGCDPCPPGERYVLYKREKRLSNLITL